MIAKQTDPKAKAHLQALLKKAQSAESLSEGRKKRIVLFKPCSECKQEEGKIDECQRCHGCGIDPEFVVRMYEDPRNYLNESATRRLLDFADNGIQLSAGTYDPETLRQTIAYLMRTLGIGYEEARDIAMTHHDPRVGGAREPMQSAEPEVPDEPPVTPSRTETHCMRCGSRHHTTKDCHLGGIPL
jgi:ribosomal protein S14